MDQWSSSKHNMGMTLNREQWKKIVTCSPEFCQVIEIKVLVLLELLGILTLLTKTSIFINIFMVHGHISSMMTITGTGLSNMCLIIVLRINFKLC